MYFITIKRMLEVCFSAHPNIQYRANYLCETNAWFSLPSPIFICKLGSPTAHSAHNVYSKPSNRLQTLPPNPGYLPYIH